MTALFMTVWDSWCASPSPQLSARAETRPHFVLGMEILEHPHVNTQGELCFFDPRTSLAWLDPHIVCDALPSTLGATLNGFRQCRSLAETARLLDEFSSRSFAELFGTRGMRLDVDDLLLWPERTEVSTLPQDLVP